MKKVAKMTVFSWIEHLLKTLGKGENADYQHFLLYPQCFPKPSLLWLLKVGIAWERVNKEPSQNILGKGENASEPSSFPFWVLTNYSFS